MNLIPIVKYLRYGDRAPEDTNSICMSKASIARVLKLRNHSVEAILREGNDRVEEKRRL